MLVTKKSYQGPKCQSKSVLNHYKPLVEGRFSTDAWRTLLVHYNQLKFSVHFFSEIAINTRISLFIKLIKKSEKNEIFENMKFLLSEGRCSKLFLRLQIYQSEQSSQDKQNDQLYFEDFSILTKSHCSLICTHDWQCEYYNFCRPSFCQLIFRQDNADIGDSRSFLKCAFEGSEQPPTR